MYASVLSKYGQFEWKRVPQPEMADDEVLIKVKYASICGTDQHIFKGEFDGRTKTPLIPGHEFTGTISEMGGLVRGFQPGDRVVVDPILWCGKCGACQKGHYPACNSLRLLGIDMDGGFAEYINVKQDMLYKLPDSMPLKHAALIELMAIGFHASKRSGLKKEDTLAIWGSGKVGQCILQAARTITQNTIFMIDVLNERLSVSKEAYPDVICLNSQELDPNDKILKYTGGKGVDVAFEAVGHPEIIENRPHPIMGCVRSVRGGGSVCVLGLSDDSVPVPFKELILKEVTLITSRVTHGEFSDVIQSYEKGLLSPNVLISEILPGERAQEAFEKLDKYPEKFLKILLDFTILHNSD